MRVTSTNGNGFCAGHRPHDDDDRNLDTLYFDNFEKLRSMLVVLDESMLSPQLAISAFVFLVSIARSEPHHTLFLS